AGGRELGVRIPGELRVELPLERPGLTLPGGDVDGREVRGQLDPGGAAHEEVAADAEENGLRPRGRGLPAPLRLDAQEPGDEEREGPGRGHEEPGAGQGVQRRGLAAVVLEASRRPGVGPSELVEERAVQRREAVVAVEVLVGESRLAEREVPLGRPWRWNRG